MFSLVYVDKMKMKLAELGNDGWELVAVTETVSGVPYYTLFFKRPIV